MKMMTNRRAAAAFAALAQETRLGIFRLLVEAGPEGLPAGEIAARLKVAAPTLSFHLSHLRLARLVLRRRAGRQQIYVADLARMADLTGFLTDQCCGGRPELCKPRTTASQEEFPHDRRIRKTV